MDRHYIHSNVFFLLPFAVIILVTTACGETALQHEMASNKIIAWGNDDNGQVSNLPEDGEYVAVSVGNLHSLALRKDGRITAWGWDRKNETSGAPDGKGFVAISVGYTHSLALHENGTITAWGWDMGNKGQTLNTPTDRGFVAIAAGDYHYLAISH